MYNTEKVCTRCGETKPLDQFNKKAAKLDGRMAECRECNHARAALSREATYARTKAYRLTHHDKAAEYKRRENERRKEKRAELKVLAARALPVIEPKIDTLCNRGVHHWFITANYHYTCVRCGEKDYRPPSAISLRPKQRVNLTKL